MFGVHKVHLRYLDPFIKSRLNEECVVIVILGGNGLHSIFAQHNRHSACMVIYINYKGEKVT